MKIKWQLFSSVFQLIVGTLAVLLYGILGLGGENMIKWTGTLILAIAFIVLGVIGILDYRLNK